MNANIAAMAGLGILAFLVLKKPSIDAVSNVNQTPVGNLPSGNATNQNLLNQPPPYSTLGNQGDTSQKLYSNPAQFVDTESVCQPYTQAVTPELTKIKVINTSYTPVGTINTSTGRVEQNGVQVPQAYHALVGGRGGHYT